MNNSPELTRQQALSIRSGRIFKMVTNAVVGAGAIVLIVCLGSSGRNKVIGMLVGYGFLIAGVILFMSNVLAKMVQTSNEGAKDVLTGLITISVHLSCFL